MTVGETKDIIIGTLTAYFDPDLQKENNPFCAIGFRHHLDLITNDGNFYDRHDFSSGNYSIDSDSLAVTIHGFEAPSGVAGE